jgi:hypothetical protein
LKRTAILLAAALLGFSMSAALAHDTGANVNADTKAGADVNAKSKTGADVNANGKAGADINAKGKTGSNANAGANARTGTSY